MQSFICLRSFFLACYKVEAYRVWKLTRGFIRIVFWRIIRNGCALIFYMFIRRENTFVLEKREFSGCVTEASLPPKPTLKPGGAEARGLRWNMPATCPQGTAAVCSPTAWTGIRTQPRFETPESDRDPLMLLFLRLENATVKGLKSALLPPYSSHFGIRALFSE